MFKFFENIEQIENDSVYELAKQFESIYRLQRKQYAPFIKHDVLSRQNLTTINYFIGTKFNDIPETNNEMEELLLQSIKIFL